MLRIQARGSVVSTLPAQHPLSLPHHGRRGTANSRRCDLSRQRAINSPNGTLIGRVNEKATLPTPYLAFRFQHRTRRLGRGTDAELVGRRLSPSAQSIEVEDRPAASRKVMGRYTAAVGDDACISIPRRLCPTGR